MPLSLRVIREMERKGGGGEGRGREKEEQPVHHNEELAARRKR